MIAELGLIFLWLAAALSILQLGLGAQALTVKGADFAPSVRPVAILQAILVSISFGMLLLLFARTDLSVLLVATNSHSMKPMMYKIAGAFGNHEGSMLLWVTIMALSGGAIALLEKRLDGRMMAATLAAQAFVSIGFYAFLLFSSNPFERINPVPAEGQGLNPLLQDPGLTFHPPTLYLGYVGLSIAFSFAVGAMITRQVGPLFAKAMRPWVLGAWIWLTIGITAGSWWAYYELGWGGWWFWDPVENASLMPWLAATALLHSVTVLANRNALKTWTIMLAVVAFSMSMVGTFLVRSGILTSVHAFAVDPERGSFILALLAIYIGGALLLFGMRASTITEGKKFALISREGALVVNNVMLMAILGVVLFGTLYPLMTEAFDTKVSVGPPYFNPTGAIFAIPMILVMAVGPLLRWKKDDFKRVMGKIAAPFIVGIAAIVLTMIFAGDINILPLLGIGLAAMLALASIMPLVGRNLMRTPLPIWGMVLAHLGLAVSLFGMAQESAFTTEKLVASQIGDTHQIGNLSVTLNRVIPIAGPNWTALQAELLVKNADGTLLHIAHPDARHFPNPPTDTSEAALFSKWNGQLYAVLGEQAENAKNGQERWQLRLWWKPFAPFIWFGGLLIAFGGFIALIGRVLQDRKSRRSTEEAENDADESAGVWDENMEAAS